MRIVLLSCLLVFSCLCVRAQTLKGIILSADSLKPLSSVVVYDLYTSQSALTDEQGYFALAVNANDMLSFSLPGYRTFQETAPASMEIKVHLSPMDILLKEYVVHNFTQFQRDSAEMASVYDKELNTKRIKPAMGTPDGSNGAGVGIAMDGLIGSAVQKISRSYKQNKRFKENFKRDMEQKFIDTRYTPELVTKMTGYTGDTMILFMNTYPMDYSFARAASDLEIKMWIRNNYKEHIQRKTMDAADERK